MIYMSLCLWNILKMKTKLLTTLKPPKNVCAQFTYCACCWKYPRVCPGPAPRNNKTTRLVPQRAHRKADEV